MSDTPPTVSTADIDFIKGAVQRGELTLAQVGGFSKKELSGAYIAAVQLLRANRPAKALQAVGMLMVVDPKKPAYFQLAGIALQRLRKYEYADAYYRVAERLDPKDPLTTLYRGECNVMMGDIGIGRALLERGIKTSEGRADMRPYVDRAKTVLATIAPHKGK